MLKTYLECSVHSIYIIINRSTIECCGVQQHKKSRWEMSGSSVLRVRDFLRSFLPYPPPCHCNMPEQTAWRHSHLGPALGTRPWTGGSRSTGKKQDMLALYLVTRNWSDKMIFISWWGKKQYQMSAGKVVQEISLIKKKKLGVWLWFQRNCSIHYDEIQWHLPWLLHSYLIWWGIMALRTYFQVKVQVKHFKHFTRLNFCLDWRACQPQGTIRGHMEFPVKIKNQQEALVTVVEAGVVVALAQASSDTQSPSGSPIWGRNCIRAGGWIIGLPWLDAISSVTAGISCILLSALYETTGRAAASAHLGAHTTHSSLQQAVDFIIQA